MLGQEWLREGRLEETLAELQARVRKDRRTRSTASSCSSYWRCSGGGPRAHPARGGRPARPGRDGHGRTYRQAIAARGRGPRCSGARRGPRSSESRRSGWPGLSRPCGSTARAITRRRRAEARAFDAAPRSRAIDGKPFAWIADADARLGPILEVVVRGRYAWLPFQRVRRSDSSRRPTCAICLDAGVHHARDGRRGARPRPRALPGLRGARGCAPPLPPDGVEESRRRRRVLVGAGQRTLATDGDEHALMDVRSVQLEGVRARRR